MHNDWTAAGLQFSLQLIAQDTDSVCTILRILCPELQCPCHSGNQWNWFRSGAPSMFLMSAFQEWREPDAAFQQQTAHAARSMKLVGTKRQSSGIKRLEINRRFPNSLDSVQQQCGTILRHSEARRETS